MYLLFILLITVELLFIQQKNIEVTVMAILDKVCGCYIYCKRRLFSDYSAKFELI